MTEADERFMRLALDHAERARTTGDVPVGAVVVQGDEVLASATNEREARPDPTAHAELLALKDASQKLGTWRLSDCTLYVTLEPCPMCSGAVVLARLARLVYGTQDPRGGAAYSLYNIPQDPRLNHHVEITTGVLEERCRDLLSDFFKDRR